MPVLLNGINMALFTSSKLLCIKPGYYWYGWPFAGTLS